MSRWKKSGVIIDTKHLSGFLSEPDSPKPVLLSGSFHTFPPYCDLNTKEPMQQFRNCVLVRQNKCVVKEKEKGIKLRPMSLTIQNFT